MDTNTAILVSLLLPMLATVSNLLHPTQHNLRDGLTFIAALGTFACVVSIFLNTGGAPTETFKLFSVMPGLDVAFHVEPLGHALCANSVRALVCDTSLCHRIYAR